MAADIKAISMPKWGMEMSEGDINEWLVAEGDEVSSGDDLVDVETSKIVNTVTSPASGVLRRILAKPGQTMPVGSVLGVIASAETSDADIDAFVQKLAPEAAPEPAASEPAKAAEPAASKPAAAKSASVTPISSGRSSSQSQALAELAKGEDDSEVSATAVARRIAKENHINLHNVKATGRHNRVTLTDLHTAVAQAGGSLALPQSESRSAVAVQRDDSAVKATPVARRLARDLGINLLECRVSGSRGRVSKADVEAAVALKRPAAAGAASASAAAEAPVFEEIPMAGMRKTIASRLQASKQTAPHFRVNIDAEIDALLATRKQLNASRGDAKISVNDFIVKACAAALQQVPGMNVQFDGEIIRRFDDADIAVAVALDEGLITPILKQANRKGLVAISNEIRDLATRAKVGRLKNDEIQGGTFTVSNLGMFGIKNFDAIINPPQGAILAVGAGEQRPVVRNGELAVATVVSLSLASDHRIIDGALAAQFMAALKQFLEQPATMLA